MKAEGGRRKGRNGNGNGNGYGYGFRQDNAFPVRRPQASSLEPSKYPLENSARLRFNGELWLK
jgi:hypothetical protein